MKSISVALKAHIQGEVTTVCTCISITRRDGLTFGLTDHDQVLVVANQRYIPYNSYMRTSISNTDDLEVQQMEIDGILNSDAFAREDIGSGLFDFAKVSVFVVNYMDTTMGVMQMRTGWLGEIECNEDNSFNAEIRGLSQVFSYRIGLPYAPECNADLGDVRCKIGLDPGFWSPAQVYRTGDCIIGHIDAASGYVNAVENNNDFSEETDGTTARLATGWITYGDADGEFHFSSDWESLGAPPGGAIFAAVTDSTGTTVTTQLGMYQDVSLVDSGLTTDDIDLGLCRIEFTGWVAAITDSGATQLRLTAMDANGIPTTVFDSGKHSYAKLRWITLTASDVLIPAGTRNIRVDFLGHKAPHTGWGSAFGGYIMSFNDPNGTFNSDDQASGVMFQAQNTGTSGATEPAFAVTLGDTYVDGTITWKCVKSFKDVSTVGTVTSQQAFEASLPQSAGYYDGGLLVWETGANAGTAMEVKTWLDGVVSMFQRTFYPITIGDRFVIHPGCNKTRATCIAKFANILNFRGFPDVPGQDAYMQTPDSPTTS